MLRATLKSLAFAILLFSGLATLFVSHASSPDYRALFWAVLPFAALHSALTVYFSTRAPLWGKCCLAVFSSLALLSFLELTLRVWFHVRLF
jgi:hypothetical protein